MAGNVVGASTNSAKRRYSGGVWHDAVLEGGLKNFYAGRNGVSDGLNYALTWAVAFNYLAKHWRESEERPTRRSGRERGEIPKDRGLVSPRLLNILQENRNREL